MLLAQNVLDLMDVPAKVRAEADKLKKQNKDLANNVRNKGLLATRKPTRVRALSQELISVMSKPSVSRLECADLRWNARRVAKFASNVKDDEINALSEVSRDVDDATEWKVAIIGMELTDTLKQVLIQIEMESQAAISSIQGELERNESGASRNVVPCRAVLHNRVAEVCCTLLDTDSLMVDTEVINCSR